MPFFDVKASCPISQDQEARLKAGLDLVGLRVFGRITDIYITTNTAR